MKWMEYLHVTPDKEILHVAISLTIIAFLAGGCTGVTLYCNFSCSVVYFTLYIIIISYVLENWVFFKEVMETSSLRGRLQVSESKIEFLKNVIRTLSVEIQHLKNITCVTPRQERFRKVKSTGSFDGDFSEKPM